MILNLVNNKLKLAKGQSLQEKLDFFERNYDFQFYSIKKIINKYPDKKAQILFGIIQNALISYQLSGTGERWREEFSNFMIDNLDTFLTDNCLFWKRFLSVCKNNRRFINNKLKRIQKIADVKQFIENRRKLLYQNMIELNNLLAQIMGQTINAKTIVFAVKMFGYGARIDYQFILYPFDIPIPVDSRIKKIFFEETKKKKVSDSQIREYFNYLAQKLNIPPLHLDSLLWVEV